jgi:hypothetical protein
MDLYIANTTKQHHDFVYRVPETVAMRTQKIRVGTQVKIAGVSTTQEIDYVLNQHLKYGLVHVSAIDTSKGLISMLYSDKPISSARIEQAMRYNDGVLIKAGKKIREEAAIADSVRLEQNIVDEDLPATLRQYEASIVEEDPGKRSAASEDAIAEGVRVSRFADPDGHVPPPSGPASREVREAGRAGRRGRRAA